MMPKKKTQSEPKFSGPNTSTSPIEVDGVRVTGDHRRQGRGDRCFEHAADIALGRLQHAVGDLLRAGPEQPRKAADVDRMFGLDHRLGWQIYRIAHAATALASGPYVPARVSMNKLLATAARKHVPPDVIAEVSEAYEGVDKLIREHATDRSEFDAMVRAFLPEERAKQDLESREGAVKMMGQVKGVMMEAAIDASFLHPSADGKRVDRASIVCNLGLRRTRPNARIEYWTAEFGAHDNASLTLEGSSISDPRSMLLPPFCTQPTPPFEISTLDGMTSYRVLGEEVGLSSAIDLVVASQMPAGMNRFRKPNGPRTAGVFFSTDTPLKHSTLDVFVHRDVYPQSAPELAAYDIVPRGVVRSFDEPARRHDRIEIQETVRSLGRGIAQARLPHMPRYLELLESVCATLGWNPEDFRGYRLDLRFPVYGAQYLVGFEMPEDPVGV
jgi:hypothetical protein